VPKDAEKNKEIDLVLLVFFSPAELMHLISTLVLQIGQHIKQSLLIPQVKVL